MLDEANSTTRWRACASGFSPKSTSASNARTSRAQDLALVRRYILLNRQAILDHWNEYTDGVELIRALKSLVP
jgi:hypothetical protein